MKKFLPAALVVCFLLHSSKSYSQLLLNEICPSNSATIIGPTGDYDDWIELYNAGSQTIDLKGVGLSDNSSDPYKFRFSSGSLASHAHMLVFPTDHNFSETLNHWEMPVEEDDDWRYFAANSQPDTNWRNPSFNDHVWPQDEGGFGRGDGDDHTTIPACFSVCIRKHFNVSDPSNILKAILSIDYDDGFIAYLNGFEIARANLGSPGERPMFNDFASESHEALGYQGDTVETFAVNNELLRQILVAGDNVLAIEVHNADSTFSDMTSNANLFFGVKSSAYLYSHVPSAFHLPSVDSYEAAFKLSSSGETIYLHDSLGNVLDQQTFTEVKNDNSYARSTDGAPTWCYYATPTPDDDNNSTCYAGYCPPPVFSIPAGFYPGSFTLHASTTQSGGTVRFSNDGADIKSTSASFSGGLNLNSTMTVKAAVFAPGYLPSATITNTYFINEQTHLPVFTITTAPENLWNYYTGIYVYGPNADSINSPYLGSNFWEDWKRPASIEYYDKEKNRLFTFGADIGMYGNYTRAKPQKTFEIKMKQKYGLSSIHYSLLPNKPEIQDFNDFILRNAGQDWNKAHFRDAFLERVMKPTHSGYLAAEPTVMYLNGQYWGLYSIGENHDASFIKNNYGYDEDQIDYLLEGGHITTKKGSPNDFVDLVKYATTQNASTTSYYNYVNNRVDLENFTDYLIAETYYHNQDWMGSWTNNIKIWRPVGGKWHYILYDLDATVGFGGVSASFNSLETLRNPNSQNMTSDLFDAILNNPTFKIFFINRYADLMNTIFTSDSISTVLHSYKDSMNYDMTKHCARWGYNMHDWNNAVDDVSDYLDSRASHVRDFIESDLGMNSQVDLTLKVSPSGAGRIHINTIDPKTFPWDGTYFNGNPVTITAIPNPGYSFNHWRSNVVINTNDNHQVLTKNFTADDVITAYFTGAAANPEIVFSELNYNSDSAFNAGDWVELHNPGSSDLDISGWVLKDDNDFHQYTFPVGTILHGGDYLVVAQDMALFNARFPMITNVQGPMTFSLNNYNDEVRLFNTSGTLILDMNYSDLAPWPLTADGDGYTCELLNATGSMSDGSNWFAGCYGGSPGRAFSAPDPLVESSDGNIICTGSSTSLSVEDHSTWDYHWQNNLSDIPGETDADFSASASGSYTCRITGAGCTIISETVIVNVLPLPADPVVASGHTCGSGTVTLNTLSTDTIYWYNSVTGNSIHQGSSFTTPVLSTTHTYYVRANNFCPGSFVSVDAEVKSVSAAPVSGPVSVCKGNSASLHAVAADPVSWYPSASGGIPAGSGAFYLTGAINTPTTFYASAGIDCPSARVPVVITPVNNPVVNLGNDTIVATGTVLTLDAGAGYSSYLWSNLTASQTTTATGPADIWVVVTDSVGCPGTDSIHISVVTGIENLQAVGDMLLFPNPVSGILHYQFNQKLNDKVVLRLSDMNGRIMEERKISSSDLMEGEFNVRDYSAGVYVLAILTSNGQKQMMISVE